MKKIIYSLLFFGILISNYLFSQTVYSWSSFPSGGTSYNTSVGSCSMAVSVSGSEYNTVGNVPRFTNTGTLPTSNDGRNGLFIDQDWSTQTNTTTIIFNFNSPVNNPSFLIYDINRTNACSDFCSSQWNDRVILRSNSGNIITISSATPAEHTIVGSGSNNANVEAAVLCGANNANVNVSISGAVTSFTLQYTSAILNTASSFVGCASPTPSNCATRVSCAGTNPVRQFITISDITGQALAAPVAITGNLNLCSPNPTTLTATGGTGTTRWFTGSCGGTLIFTGNPLIVSPATTTTYFAANVNCNVNTACASAVVNVTTTPVANAGSSPTPLTCLTTTVPLSGSGGGGYSWTGPAGGISSGGVTSSPVIVRGGTYTLVVNSGICNSAPSTVVVTQNTTTPVVSNFTTQITCTNLTAQAGVSTGATSPGYTWSGTGITSATNISTITVNAGGTFNYTVTNGVTGCRTLGSVVVPVNTNSPTVSGTSAGTLTCSNLSVQTVVNSPSSPININWVGPSITVGALTASATVNAPGIYNYTVTNSSNGCRTFGSTTVIQNTLTPIVNQSVSNTITCSTSTVNAIASTTMLPVSYIWTGTGITSAANISTISVNQGGTFNYTVTNSTSGCRASGSLNVVQNTPTFTVSSSATSSLNCGTTTATITAITSAAPVLYVWSGPGISSGNGSSAITATLGGTYNYTVTNSSNGCITTGSFLLAQNINPALITSSSSTTLTCNTTTAQAIVVPTNTNTIINWSGPSIISGSSTGTIIVNTPGAYTYTVTRINNLCSTINTVVVTQNTITPLASAAGGTLTCAITSTVLIGGPLSGVTYSWSGSGLSGATTLANATATTTGNYTLTTTSIANGCKNIAIATVTNNLSTSIVSAGSSQTLVCGASSVTLTGTVNPLGSSATWLGGVCGSAIVFTTTACAPGTYTLVATHPVSGCPSVSTVVVSSSTNIPQATVNSITNSITCTNTVVTIGVTLSNSDPVSYAWNGPGISGANNTAITTSTLAGIYSVTITNTSTNCQSIFNVTVPTNTTLVAASAVAGATITCNTSTVTLAASPTGANYAYGWSGPGTILNGSTQNPIVNTGGNYIVTILNSINGCIGNFTLSVPSNTLAPTMTLTPTSLTTTCSNPTATLLVTSSSAPAVSYTWTAPPTGNLNNINTSNPIASGSGIFTVQVTNTTSGCVSAIATLSITGAANIPSLVATSSSSLVCANQTATLTISGTDTYTWSANAGSSNSSSVAVTPSITTLYSVAGTNTTTGCSNVTNVTVNVTQTPTVNIAASATTICQGNNATLTLTGATSYTIANPSQTTTNTISLSPTTQTTYTIIGESSNCISGAQIITINVNPLPLLATSDATTCAGVPVTLAASGADTYTWSTSSNASATTVAPTSNTNYTVIGTNTLTGCSSTLTTVNVNVNQNPIVTASANPNTTCTSSTVNLNAASSGTTAITNYTWTLGNGVTITNQNLANPNFSASSLTVGTYVYTVQVTNSNNCLSTPATATLTVIDLPNANFNLSNLNICQNENGTITINAPQTGVTYDWNINGQTITNSNPLTLPSSSTSIAGTYTISVIASLGTCINTAANTLTVNGLPNIALISPTVSACQNASVQLDIINPNGTYIYNWTNGQNSNTGTTLTIKPLTQLNAGTYTITAINQNGCLNRTIAVVISQVCESYVPEIFTPNGDGKNDGFVIKNIENYPNNKLKIFNRWGNMIYQKDGYLNEFEGFANTGDQIGKSKLPAGTYYVILDYGDGKTEIYNGYLLLQY